MAIIKPPKILSKNHWGQVFFIIKETIKIAFKIAPGYLVLLFVLNTIWGLSSLPSFYLDKLIIDRIVGNIGNPLWRQALTGIIILLSIRLIIEVARNVLGSVAQFLRRTVTILFESGMEVLIGNKLAELDIATIEDVEFKNRFKKIEQEAGSRAWSLMMPLAHIPNELSGFVGAVLLLILLHPLIALVILVLAIPQFLVDSKFIKRDYDLWYSLAPLRRLRRWLYSYLVRSSNFLELKILGLAPFLSEKLKTTQKEIQDKEISLAKSRETYHTLTYLPTAVVELSLYVYVVILTLVQKITIGSMQMYTQALRSAQVNLAGLVSSFLEIYENYLYMVDLVWFLNLQPKINPKSGGLKLPSIKDEVRFENVWFRYREDTPWILKNINLTIKPGEKLAIVGENGAGKSTLIKLLARFYDPEKGNIYVGDKNLKEFNVGDWHERLAVLFQRFEDYPFTARESIGYGDVSRVNEINEIKRVAKKTKMDNYIEGLPMKYENPLAVEFDKGVNPSIGQWQRIGISRMLFRKKADMLVLDEPTSNVDPKAEEEIFNELINHAENKILVFISQRFSTVRLADQILLIENGQVSEQGNHKDLMKQKGTYANLFNLQAKGYQ